MQIITTLSELQRKIQECNDTLTNDSDHAMRHLLNNFRMDFPKDAPPDPFSSEYRAFQMEIYRTLSGKSYSTRNEISNFDTTDKVSRPFPYYLRNSVTAGHHLLAIAFMLCKFDVPPGATVIEFGPGWGNTTMELARLGYAVTALDIDPNFTEVIAARAAQIGVSVETITDEFFWIERADRQFDAALFFESFHHCHDHRRLLEALHRVVVPGGRVFLAAEPITADYGTPWGVRVDGEALWAAHNFGWLELGFDSAYFTDVLARTGWHGVRHDCSTVPWASVWELRRLEHASRPSDTVANIVMPEDDDAHDAGEPTESARPLPDPLSIEAETAAGTQAIRELEAIRRSTSWRVTWPLRATRRLVAAGMRKLGLTSLRRKMS